MRVGILLAAAVGILNTTSGLAQQAEPFRDTRLSFEERSRDLVSRMTLEENISQLGHTSEAVKRLEI